MRFALQRLTIHGREIAYRSAGQGPVVVLLHGMAGSSMAWRPVMDVLASRFRVIAPDLLGHGASAKPDVEYNLGAHANMMRDFLLALGLDRVTLVGQSFGGGVAMQLAYQFPERCDRLVLVSSGGLGREVSGLLRALTLPGSEHVLRVTCASSLRVPARQAVGWLKRLGLSATPLMDEIVRCWGSLGAAPTRHAFLSTLRAVVDAGGQSVSAVDRLYLTAHVPTLIVWGGRDTLIPVDHAHAAHAAMPGSRLVIFDAAGHFPHCEAAPQFAAALMDFIDTTEPGQLDLPLLQELVRRGPVARPERSSAVPISPVPDLTLA